MLKRSTITTIKADGSENSTTMHVNQKNLSEADKNIIGQLWFKYSPYWPLFVLFFGLAVAAAWFFLKISTPLYESTASILIKDEKKGEDDSKVVAELNQLSSKKIIENETEVLKSRTLMNEVVRKLHLYAPIYQEGRFRPRSAYVLSPVVIEALNPDAIQPTKRKVYFTYSSEKKQVNIGGRSFALNQWANTPYGTLKFIPQDLQYNSKAPLYFYLIDPKRVALSLIEDLEILPASKLSSVLDLKIRSEVPKRGEDILNTLITFYARSSVNDKNTLASNTLSFVNQRLAAVTHDLDSIQKKLQQYKTNNNAVDISSQGTLYLQNVSQVDQKLNDVNTEIAVLDQVEGYVKSKDNAGSIVPSTFGVSDPLLTQLLDKLYDAELQYEKLRKTTPENNPIMISLNNQIEKIKPNILENIRSQKSSLQANKSALNTTNNHFTSGLQTLPQKEKDLVEISRQENVKSNVYNFLLQKKEETELSLSATMTDSRVIDYAESTIYPVSPKTLLVFGIAAVFGLLLPMGLTYAQRNL